MKKLLVTILNLSIFPSFAAVNSMLFVDTGNTGRSISAEVIAKVMKEQREAGFKSLNNISSRAVNLAETETEEGSVKAFEDYLDHLDPQHKLSTNYKTNIINYLKNHEGQQLVADDISSANIVIGLTANHVTNAKNIAANNADKAKVISLSQCAWGTNDDIADPYHGTEQDYAQAYLAIGASLIEMQEHFKTTGHFCINNKF